MFSYECPICFEKKNVTTKKVFECKHSMCNDCLLKYINSKKVNINCPYCRQPISDEIVAASNKSLWLFSLELEMLFELNYTHMIVFIIHDIVTISLEVTNMFFLIITAVISEYCDLS